MANRIVFFINSLSSGGAEHQLCTLANMLVERDYKTTIVTYNDSSDHYKLSPLVQRVRIAKGKAKVTKLLKVWFYLLHLDASCVISFCQRNSFIALIPLFFRSRRKIRVICGERNFTIGKSDFYENALVNYLYKRADYIVSNSYSQEKHLLSIAPQLSNKLLTITNYTDLNRFTVASSPNNNHFKIGIFSRYASQKNCYRFADAIKLVAQESLLPFRVYWYGDITSNDKTMNRYYLEFKNYVNSIGVSRFFELNGRVPDPSIIIKEMDCICLPSLYEGFSNSVSEGICSGKPMLVSDVSDNSIMVKEGVNGFLFDPTNVHSIRDAILHMLKTTEEEREWFSHNSRQIAERLFNKESFIDSYLRLIND